ncbi:MAG: Gldg family protein, partial [Amphiplicatus sp.]
FSPATKRYLRDLEEPLLFRGYFSSQTHPLLAPLAPRLQDLLKEYEVAGEGRVRVEIVDPIKSPAIEEEAGRRFGVRPVPFQTTSKYQASVTNSYFDVVIQYGDEFEKLGFEDLIEVKQSGPSDVEVDLRNPEYDITRAIKKVLTSFRAAGAIWTALPGPVALKAYISDTTDLPEPLPTLKSDIEALIKDYETESGGKFSGEIIDPSAGDGAVAKALEAKGLRSMSLGLLDPRKFWFHLVLDEGGRSVDVPLPETPNKDALKRVIDAELKRLAPGAIRTVALYTPPIDPGQPEYDAPPSGLRFSRLEAQLRENAQIRQTELDNGRAPEQADALVVVAPVGLDDRQRYAIDQFLMRGGTVILAASAFRPQLTNELGIKQSATGLDDMLAHYGVTIKKEMALDEENTPLPVPVTRDVGGFQIRDIRMLDYPHFIDIRGGLAKAGAPTAGLGQLTMSWASPIEIDAQKTENMTVTRLIESSDHSWASASEEIVPDYGAYPDRGYPDPEKTGKQLLGVMLEGSFASYFAGRPNPLLQAEKTAAGGGEEKGEAPGAEVVSSTMERSPPGARLVVYGSSSFLSDDALSLISGLDRSDYAAPMILIENTIDWSLEDRGLLDIRNRQGHFARSLAPLDDGARAFWEGLNYMLALVGLVAAFVAHRMIRQSTNRRRLDALKA